MYQQNQLNFNTDVATKPINMAVKFRQPQPLVIEKFSHAVPITVNSFANHSQSAVHLSTVSEEQMSFAVNLAKRDLQKQKEAEVVEKHLAKVNKGKAKAAEKPPSNRLHFKSTRKQEPKPKAKKIGQTQTKKAPKPVIPQPKGVLHMNAIQYTPGNPVVNESLDGVVTMSHEEFTLREIRRLKIEMDNCLSQMKKIEDVAKNGRWVARTLPGTEDLSEKEVQRRRAEWAKKQDHQSSRVVYTLQQQVRAIQKDLGQTKSPFTPKVRKQFLQRVAATYRKAVRGLQTLVNQLVDYDLSKGLPQACLDFQQLMRHLAMCTAQLDIVSGDHVPESVKEVFEDILKQIEVSGSVPDNSVASFDKVNYGKPGPSIIRKETIPRPIQDMSAVSASPERQQALRQGIQALIRAADVDDSVVSSAFQRPHRSKAVAWEVPIIPRKNKGLLLPHSLQAKRRAAGCMRQSRPRQRVNHVHTRGHDKGAAISSHYSGPTVSSKLRAVPPHSPGQERRGRPAWYSPGRSTSPKTGSSERGVSPRECLLQNIISEGENTDAQRLAGSNTAQYHAPHDRGSTSVLSYPRGNPRLDKPWGTARREIQRQVHFDSRMGKDARSDNDARNAQIEKLHGLRSEVRQHSQWAEDAAGRIRDDLQPILRESQVHQNTRHLADLILQDALNETITELENGEFLDSDTRSLDTPTLETMLQKMHEMEKEENLIRQRWATITYEDANSRRAKFYDAEGSDRPRTPPSLEIVNEPSRARSSDRELEQPNPSDVEPIVFSRPAPQKSRYERLHLSSRGFEVSVSNRKVPQPSANNRTPLFLSPDLVARIHENRQRYSEHLQTHSNVSIGKFDPWHLTEMMADEIVDECLNDVVNEIEEIHMDIANNIYESEFKTLKSSGSSQDFDNKDSDNLANELNKNAS